MQSLLKAKDIEIAFDLAIKILICNWLGFLNKESMIFSSNIFAEISPKKAMPASDVIKSFGSYREASDWLMKQ